MNCLLVVHFIWKKEISFLWKNSWQLMVHLRVMGGSYAAIRTLEMIRIKKFNVVGHEVRTGVKTHTKELVIVFLFLEIIRGNCHTQRTL
jgi:hypothetical protein